MSVRSNPILFPHEYLQATAEKYAGSINAREAQKGPHPIVFPQPVRQEIPFEPLDSAKYRPDRPIPVPMPYNADGQSKSHHELWPHWDDEYELGNQEDILTAHAPVEHPLTYDIMATHNRSRFLCHCRPHDFPLVQGAYQSRLPRLKTREVEDPLARYFETYRSDLETGRLAFGLLAAFPPEGVSYAEILTPAESFQSNTYASFFQMGTELEEDEVLVARAMWTPCAREHDWMGNVEFLKRENYRLRQGGSLIPTMTAYPQGAPDSYLPFTAADTRRKADRDQGFLAFTMLMFGLFRPERVDRFRLGFEAYFAQFRFGGRALRFLDEQAYIKAFNGLSGALQALTTYLPYSQGWILSTEEAVSFTQIPLTLPIIREELVAVDCRRYSEIPPELFEGTHLLGYASEFGDKKPIYLPVSSDGATTTISNFNSVSIGLPGSGKSTLNLARCLLWSREPNCSLFMFDPHEKVTKDVLPLLPSPEEKPTILFRLDDYPNVPCWYPSVARPGEDIGRIAWDLAGNFLQGIPGSKGWHRMKNLTYNVCLVTLVWPEMTFAKVGTLILSKQGRFKEVAAQNRVTLVKILESLGRTENVRFWSSEFVGYQNHEISPLTNKLGNLLGLEIPNQMFDLGPSRSLINFERLCETPSIFINLAGRGSVGPEIAYTSSMNQLSELLRIMYRRINRPIHNRVVILIDETRFFDPTLIETLFTEGRKARFEVHAMYPSLPSYKDDALLSALGGAGLKFYFQMAAADAARVLGTVHKQDKGDIHPEDLERLRRGEAFINLGGRLIRMETPFPVKAEHDFTNGILAYSRQYYRTIDELGKVTMSVGTVSSKPKSGNSKPFRFEKGR